MTTLAQTRPEVADVWSAQALALEYADDLFISRKILNSPEKIAALGEARAKQAQVAASMAAAQHAAQTAQTLSQTPVGSGMSAMSMMTGLGSTDPGGGGLAGAAPAGNA